MSHLVCQTQTCANRGRYCGLGSLKPLYILRKGLEMWGFGYCGVMNADFDMSASPANPFTYDLLSERTPGHQTVCGSFRFTVY